MRMKKRWLLYTIQIEQGQKLAPAEARFAINEALFSFFGEAGASRAEARVHEFDEAKQALLIRCNLGSLEQVIAALMLKRFFRSKGVALRLQKLAGSAGSIWPPVA